MFTVRLRHKNKVTRFRYFVVQGDSPALLEMPDIELLGILKIMCKEVEYQLGEGKTKQPSNGYGCKANIGQ